jgi:small-conductance mechanosensitive channel
MKLIRTVAATFSVTLLMLGTAQLPAQDAAQATTISTKEAHSLMKTAHELAEYQELAAYFRQQEQSYRVKRDQELALWNTRAQGIAANQNKYPRPVDSAHNLYDYYAHETDHAAAQAQHYEQLTTVAQSK